MPHRQRLISLLLAFLLTACGQKGALYFPPEPGLDAKEQIAEATLEEQISSPLDAELEPLGEEPLLETPDILDTNLETNSELN